MYKVEDLFDLSHTLAAEQLKSVEGNAWEALSKIGTWIKEIGENLDPEEYHEIKSNVWVHKTAYVYESAYLNGPCIIGKGSEVRHCAFVRGNALVGDGCVVGNSVELKNVILFDNVQVPHFNYVGDSILGYKSHMGAGAVTSNVKSDKCNIVVRGEEDVETGLKKFGALLGDHVEVGCNAVLNPGTIIGRNSSVYPTSCVRGYVPEESIFKNTGKVCKKI